MSKLPTCCEYYNVDCNQRRNCPVDAIATFYAETEGVMAMPTGCSTKALPDPKRQPLPELEQGESIAWAVWLVVSCFAVMSAWIFVQYAPHIFRSLK